MNLGEWIDLCSMSAKSGSLDCWVDELPGTVYLYHGQVIHATWNSQTGEEAFYSLARAGNNSWIFQEKNTDSSPRTIQLPTSKLLLEAARLADEKKSSPAPAPPKGDYLEGNASFHDILKIITRSDRIAILSHIRADGDCLGSQIGLAHCLRQYGHQVFLFNQEGMSYLMEFLPGAQDVHKTPVTAPELDLIIALDTSTQERLGKNFVGWNRPVDIVLDHHVTNTRYGKINHIRPDLPATAALITELAEAAGWTIPPEAATNFYTGIMTDTGSFRYRGTSPETLRMAAKLIELGADPAELARQCYQSISPGRFKLQREVFNATHLECDDKLAWAVITPQLFQQTGATPEDTEGLVERLLEIKTVQISAVFEEAPPDTLRVSFRSKGANVSELASRFGGGGHPLAAGARILKCNIQEKLQNVLAALQEAASRL